MSYIVEMEVVANRIDWEANIAVCRVTPHADNQYLILNLGSDRADERFAVSCQSLRTGTHCVTEQDRTSDPRHLSFAIMQTYS